MSYEFTHLVYRDSGNPDLLDEIELSVTATANHGEVDDISWLPEIELTQKEHDALHTAACQALAEARTVRRIEARQNAAIERELDRMGL